MSEHFRIEDWKKGRLSHTTSQSQSSPEYSSITTSKERERAANSYKSLHTNKGFQEEARNAYMSLTGKVFKGTDVELTEFFFDRKDDDNSILLQVLNATQGPFSKSADLTRELEANAYNEDGSVNAQKARSIKAKYTQEEVDNLFGRLDFERTMELVNEAPWDDSKFNANDSRPGWEQFKGGSKILLDLPVGYGAGKFASVVAPKLMPKTTTGNVGLGILGYGGASVLSGEYADKTSGKAGLFTKEGVKRKPLNPVLSGLQIKPQTDSVEEGRVLDYIRGNSYDPDLEKEIRKHNLLQENK